LRKFIKNIIKFECSNANHCTHPGQTLSTNQVYSVAG
jgi:hypothetical protein